MSIIHDVSRIDPVPLPMLCRVIGLDLGKVTDYSALASADWTIPPPAKRSPEWKPHYAVPTLHRWPLGTPYKVVTADVIRFMQSFPLAEAVQTVPPLLVVDATGVGEAVLESVAEQITKAKLKSGQYVGVTITTGSAVTLRSEARWNVAKRALVSVMQVLMGNRRLHVAPALELAPVLIRELSTFQIKVNSDTLNESFESWRERDHDDLVLAVALMCWGAERLRKAPPLPRPRPPNIITGTVRRPRW